jgi:hypothetical protein
MASAGITTAYDEFYQPPEWQIRVKLGANGAVRNAKIYHQGNGGNELHFATDTTTLVQVLEWANRRPTINAEFGPEHLKLVL